MGFGNGKLTGVGSTKASSGAKSNQGASAQCCGYGDSGGVECCCVGDGGEGDGDSSSTKLLMICSCCNRCCWTKQQCVYRYSKSMYENA